MQKKRPSRNPDKAPDGGKSHIGKGYRKISVVHIPFTEFLTSEEYKGAGFDHFARSAERWAKETLKRLRSPYAQGWYDLNDGKPLADEEIRSRMAVLKRFLARKKGRTAAIPGTFGDRMATVKARRKLGKHQEYIDEAGILTEHRRVLVAEALKAGRPMSEWVFPSEEETALDAANLRKTFSLRLKKAGLRQIRFHDLRHTFASWLIGNEESLAYVKDQMGHHSIQITVDTYGHLIPGANREAVNRLAAMVENPQPIRNRIRE